MRLLLIEDDRETSAFVVRAFEGHGYAVDTAFDGNEGLSRAKSNQYDALVVDRMLPRLDGLSLVRKLRAQGKHVPALVLTTMSSLTDRVEGLEGGADDYLAKPFATSELIARVNAIVRRTGRDITRLRIADLEIDRLHRVARRSGRAIDLQQQEFRLLEFLALNTGRVVTRAMLLEHVWDILFDPRTNIVETHMSRLRAKVDRGFAFELIHTVRGLGYILRGD